jgi:SAM-dependent methyltransferase
VKKKARYKYLLGAARKERARLQHQASIWDPKALALFERLKVRRGWRVLEIGPGQGSVHAELRRCVRGPVDVVEPSATFADGIRKLWRRDRFGDGQLWQCNLIDAPLPRNTYDLIFARWVFLFLPNPDAHVRKLAAALKPGGLLAIEDYSRWTLRMVPEPPEWENFLKADGAFFASQGGDVNIAGRLPQIYAKAGLDLVEITPTTKYGRPGNAEWKWLTTYFLGVLSKMAAFRPFTPTQAASLRRHWLRAGKNRTSLLISPTVLDVVGRKPYARKTK